VVDDDEDHLFMLRTVIGDWGHSVGTATSGKGALRLASGRKYSLILMDMRMDGDKDGLETLAALKGGDGPNRNTPVVIMTAYSLVEDAVNAIKGGADDYLIKPLDLEVVRHAIDKILSRPAVGEEKAPGAPGRPALVGESRPFLEMMELVARVAPTEATVLVTGESGAGKEMVARLIQGLSGRRSKPYVTINCAALAETLLESTLFGHRRGAFTGAEADRPGVLRSADGGTVFLDEVAETSNGFQVKLLRTLQEGEIQPLGSDRTEKVDVRFIAATNRDLKAEVEAGRFRGDLFHRLNVIPVHVPPLRERPEDIVPLARHFAGEYARKNNRPVRGLDEGALEAVRRHSWPGNIRELQNAMERAVILARGEYVTESDMQLRLVQYGPSPQEAEPGPAGGPRSLADSERQAVREAIVRHSGNKTRAAEELGVTRKTLAAKIRKYGL
jgi:two-component system response regulator HydG